MDNKLIDFPEFYSRLKMMGFDLKYIKRMVLPDWWVSEYEQTSTGAIIEAVSYASRRLNIDRDSLIYLDRTPKFNTKN